MEGWPADLGTRCRAEAQHHEEELRRAAESLEEAIQDIDVQGYFVDFEGNLAAEIPHNLPPPSQPMTKPLSRN